MLQIIIPTCRADRHAGEVGIYHLLFVCVCVSAGFFVRDISGMG